MTTREDMHEIDLFGTKVPNKSATVKNWLLLTRKKIWLLSLRSAKTANVLSKPFAANVKQIIKNPSLSYAKLLFNKQQDVDFAKRDYGYVGYFRKAMENSQEDGSRDLSNRNLSIKEKMTRQAMFHEGLRDYFSTSLRQINHLIQIDKNPNIELMEPKWELYKISVSFKPIGKLIDYES